MRTGRPSASASRHVCTCRLMSSRAPKAPPTPPSTRRTRSGAIPRQAAICLRSSCSHCVAMCNSTPERSSSGMASAASRPRNAWSCMPSSYVPSTTTSAVAVGVAAHDALAAQQVAVGMDRRVIAGDCHFGVEQRLEQAVLHHDRGEGAAAGLGVIGGHDRHRFADVAHDAVGEHRLVGGDQPVGELAGHVGGGEHHVHAGDRQRRARVERHDLGVRVRRAQRRSPHRTVERQVAGEGERAPHLRHPVGPERGITDPVRPLDASA